MSDADTKETSETGVEDTPEDPAETPSDGVEEGSNDSNTHTAESEDAEKAEEPDLDPSDTADIPDDLRAEDIEEETEPDDTTESDDGEDSEEGSEGADDTHSEGGHGSGATLGDAYASFLDWATPAMIEALDEDADPDLDEDHFREASVAGKTLPEHFNDLAEKRGFGSDMSPEQAVVLCTVMSVADPVMRETDAMDQVVAGLAGGDA